MRPGWVRAGHARVCIHLIHAQQLTRACGCQGESAPVRLTPCLVSASFPRDRWEGRGASPLACLGPASSPVLVPSPPPLGGSYTTSATVSLFLDPWIPATAPSAPSQASSWAWLARDQDGSFRQWGGRALRAGGGRNLRDSVWVPNF